MVETAFTSLARSKPFSQLQREFIIGSLLGDAYLTRTTAGYALRFHHGAKQKSYIDWKYELLKDYVRTPPKMSDGRYYFRTVTHPELSSIRDEFYPDGVKTVPLDLLTKELNSFGLAVWYMDDGSRDGKQARINTQRFTKDEHSVLRTFLSAKFGVETTINKDREYCRLRITGSSMEQFASLIRSHLTSDMLYKLSP